jgi:hypothetical protein
MRSITTSLVVAFMVSLVGLSVTAVVADAATPGSSTTDIKQPKAVVSTHAVQDSEYTTETRLAIETLLATETLLAMGEKLPEAPAHAVRGSEHTTGTFLAMGEKLAASPNPGAEASPTSDDDIGAHNTVASYKKKSPSDKKESLAEINNKLNNPGAAIAQLNFKIIWNHYKGDLPGSSSQDALTVEFQPVIPFKLADGGNLIFRPTIPMVWSPSPDIKGGFDENVGLGDTQLDIFYSRTNMKKGYMWGLGAAMQFPTHTDSSLGKDQWQLGPSGFFGLLGKWGSAGIFPQHLWNIGGSDGYSAKTYIQPWYWFNIGEGWQIGGSPQMTCDWSAESNDRWTVPINIGVAKTYEIGGKPVKFKLEAIYYITQPDAFGPCFGIQLTITPVVDNPWANIFK